ncbi:helix-turn-helix transcriptional regulator [Edaphosphingomonas haloaromaticamans]|uniref:Regulatory protein PchR n=1 Tax=Edaphosphingomonas haloaromaticamans TaxID=653954 RepID=A0A1S1HCZ0_9SPHN|nr:AraC family transcriptional regulator [Sphingomonas haloaromaticamans]OHT20007.1 Regulatory protein PchR [Sphingomonas haloaromaticamans]
MGAGSRSFREEAEAIENLRPGIKLALLLKGAIEVGIAGQTHASESGPSVNLFVSRHEWQLHHRFSSLSSLQYLTLHLDAEAADELLGDADALLPEGMAHHRATCPVAMQAIAEQILNAPYVGVARRLHLAGKALELAALALDTLARPSTNSSVSLATPLEVRRLHELRDRLNRDPANMPGLDRLARDCGMNVRRMTAGFRRLFGQSIGEYLREARLREAWRLLESGLSVTLTAEQVGYTLPHFTTAFRQRFGILPSTLNRSGLEPPGI